MLGVEEKQVIGGLFERLARDILERGEILSRGRKLEKQSGVRCECAVDFD